jgi:hypothetical protein
MALFVPHIMICVRDRNIPVKLAGERCLLYLLKLRSGDGVLKAYLDSISVAESKTLSDYHRRVLSKLVVQEEAASKMNTGYDQGSASEDQSILGPVVPFKESK